MYKIIATCIECATALHANNTREKHQYKSGALLVMIDKLMSGSSLEGKAFIRSHKLLTLRLSTSGNTKTLISKAFYFRLSS